MYPIRRFPIEPTSEYYEPTTHNLNSGGRSGYNAMPHNSKPSPYDPIYYEGDWYEGD